MGTRIVVVTYDNGTGTPAVVAGFEKANLPHAVVITSPSRKNGGGLETPIAEEMEIPRFRIYDIKYNPTKEDAK